MANKDFELLAPAGSLETFKAVVNAGADAVYVGGSMFGARAYADNFTEEQLLLALDYAHIRGVKVYLTVNTLLKNSELKDKLIEYLTPFYLKGLDAVLVQDFGALMTIHKAFPELPIHTSTQMTVTGIEGVRFLQQFGVERVVMAREVSLSEMKAIHEETGMEIEAFVHGALCYCYSGQCLMSSLLGGRSGNRGRCAQPCRLPYSVISDSKKDRNEEYILSLKDMCGIDDLPELYAAGVYSLKIEGRMKKASYAAGVVSIYRKNIDMFLANKGEFALSKKDSNHLSDLGNRCGFTDLYYKKHNDSDMVTYVKPNYATSNEAYHEDLVKEFVEKDYSISISGNAVFETGKPISLEVFCGDYYAYVTGMEAMEAQNKPMTSEDIASRLRKTGDTDFTFENLKVETSENVFVPNGAINKLRREALEVLLENMLCEYRRDENSIVTNPWDMLLLNKELSDEADSDAINSNDILYSASIENRIQLEPLLSSDLISNIYIDYNSYIRKDFLRLLAEDVERIVAADKNAYLILPAIFRKETAAYFNSIIKELSNINLKGFIVKNYEELYFVRENYSDMELVLDHNMYTYNDISKAAFMANGVDRDTMPLELNSLEIRNRDNFGTEMIIYGHYPLMTSAGCVHKNSDKCDKNPQFLWLKDRYNKSFPVKNNCNECYNVIYNCIPVKLDNEVDNLFNNGINNFRLMFTVEDEKQVEEVIRAFENGSRIESIKEFTKGHYKRGVE